MGLIPTIILALLMLGLTVFCGWRGARKPRVNGEPRLIPWRFIMLLAFIGLMLCTSHLAGLIGGRH